MNQTSDFPYGHEREAAQAAFPELRPRQRLLPTDSAARKTYPMVTGLLDYFPDALAAVAHHSFEGNQKHNPGQPIHWARGKSMDHLDALVRHITERDLVGAAWRVLAALQEDLEQKHGLPLPRGARETHP